VSALFTQYPGDTVQTGTGKVDPALKFKCTMAARAFWFQKWPYKTFSESIKNDKQLKTFRHYG